MSKRYFGSAPLFDNIEHIDEKISKEEYIVMLNEQGVHVFASKVNFINT